MGPFNHPKQGGRIKKLRAKEKSINIYTHISLLKTTTFCDFIFEKCMGLLNKAVERDFGFVPEKLICYQCYSVSFKKNIISWKDKRLKMRPT